jgi:ABC-type Fe3+/spermidine/putrescine transport system ATPase subunit
VLLLDEPLSNLDAKLRLEMRHEIRRIVDDAQITTIYVTHDQEEALSLADQMAVLRDGLLVQAGPPRKLYDAPNSRFTASFRGETNFVEGTIESIEGDTTVVATPLGRLRSARSLEKASVGDEISVSLRPEAFRLGPPTEGWNPVSTTLQRSMFLGETAQLEVATTSESMLKVLELHPRTDRSKGEAIELAIDPADVVLLPE